MSIQYKTINQIDSLESLDHLNQWADSRNTSKAVALAIHAIASPTRDADDIWQGPTSAEWDHVLMAVENYVDNGLYDAEHVYNRGVYYWGEESFAL